MKKRTVFSDFQRFAGPALLLLLIAILGFTSCRTRPKTKYGPPPVDYRTPHNN